MLLDRAIVRLLPAVPRPVVQKLSSRYIAGPELKDARETVRRVNAEGKMATIDGGRWLAGTGEFNELAMMDPAAIKPVIAAMRASRK